MRFYPLIPWFLILISATAVFVSFTLVWKKALQLSPIRKNILLTLRCASAAILVLMLFSPGIVVRELNRKRANVVFLIDGSDSMSATDMPGGARRYDAAKKVLADLLSYNYAGCGKYVYLFNHKTRPAEDPEFLEITSPFGNTDLKTAFETVDRDIGLSRIAAVTVISDGLDHSGFSGRTGIPVYAVRTGSALELVPDLRIASFRAPPALRPGEELDLEIPVEISGFKTKQKVSFQAEINGKKIAAENFELQSGERKNIPFRNKFKEPGLHRVTFSLNKLKDEVSALNNRRELFIEVKDEAIQPLLFFPVLTGAFRPLMRLFADSGRRFTAVYRMQDSYSVIGSMRENLFAHGFPKNAEPLNVHDVILLGSGSDSVLTDREVNTLEQYVSRGGTLIVLGGSGSYGSFRTRKFAAMMPVRSKNSRFVSGNFSIAEKMQTAERSGTVPAINLIDQVRDGATVTLQARTQNGSTLPLAVTMPYGRGHVTALLTNTLHPGGDPAKRIQRFRHFWEQLLIQAGGTDREKLRIASSADFIPSSGRASLTAYSENADRAEVDVLDPFGKMIRKNLPMKRNAPGHFSVQLAGLPEGRWTIRISAYSNSFGTIRRYLPVSVGESSGENDDLRVTDASFLKFCPPGHLMHPGETEKLASAITESIRKQDVLREWFPVLESYWCPLLLFLFLCAEWYLRRRFNMT